jgi:uncharacterized protein
MLSSAAVDDAGVGQAIPNAERFFKLGMLYSTGNSMPLDFVSAHKCFNIAARYGNRDAIRLRNEVAKEMSDADIVAAQRAARSWLMRQ